MGFCISMAVYFLSMSLLFSQTSGIRDNLEFADAGSSDKLREMCNGIEIRESASVVLEDINEQMA